MRTRYFYFYSFTASSVINRKNTSSGAHSWRKGLLNNVENVPVKCRRTCESVFDVIRSFSVEKSKCCIFAGVYRSMKYYKPCRKAGWQVQKKKFNKNENQKKFAAGHDSDEMVR